MEASFDVPRNRPNSEKQRTTASFVKAPLQPQGLRASVQKQQVIVPVCSAGRSGNFKPVADNSRTVKKSGIAPIAVVLSKDKRVNGNPNLFLSPFIFLSSDKSQSKKGSSSSAPCAQPSQSDKRPTLVAKNDFARKSASAVTNQNSAVDASQRNGRDSSVEAEDSLGTLLSKHFEAEDNAQPSSEIAKRRLLHEKAQIRHICSICNRECPSKHKLKRHLSTHSEDRPFACQACGRTFKWTGYLQKHIRQQHPNYNHSAATPSSPLVSPAPAQSQVTPDTPTFSASFIASPSTPSHPHTLTAGSTTQTSRHKKHKKHSKSRKKSLCPSTPMDASGCPLHRKRARTENTTSTEVAAIGKDNESYQSLMVSIPKKYFIRTRSRKEPQEAQGVTLECINSSTSPSSSASFSAAVNAIMAEPIPNCVQTNSSGGINGVTSVMGTTSVQGDTNQNQGFSGQGFQQFNFPLSSTSNNSADVFLSQDFDQSHLMTSTTQSTLSTYSTGVMSAQSASNSMNVSNSIQNKDQVAFPGHSTIDPLSQTQSFSSSLQPPDLIQTASQFDPLASNMQFEQQLNDMQQFGYSEALNNPCAMFGGNSTQLFDSNSTLDDLSLSGLGFMSSPNDMAMFDSCMVPSPSFLELQQARQLFYENTQQMRRILRSYQSLQNTLLRVTAGAMLSSSSMYNAGPLDDRGLLSQQINNLPSLTPDPSQSQLQLNNSNIISNPSMSQSRDHMTNHQSNVQDHMTESHDLSQNHMHPHATSQGHMMQDFLPENITAPHLPSSVTSSVASVDTPADIFNTSQICEPDDLLNQIISEDEPTSDTDPYPVESTQRLDNDSLFDVGIQCELGPETLVALQAEEEEQVEESNQTDELEEFLTNVNLADTDLSSPTLEKMVAIDPTSVPPLICAPLSEEDSPESLIDLTEEPATPDQDSTEPSKVDNMVNKYRCGAQGCGKAYMHRKDLTRHIKIRHGAYVMPKMLKPVAMETTEKPYTCSVPSCGRSYHHMRDLRRHQRNCHDENSKSQTDSPSAQKKEQAWEYNSLFGKVQLRFPCDFPGCVRSYVHKKDLVRHKRLYHKDSSSKPTVPVPVPYSDTDLRFIRHEVKQEVEQLMKKDRLNSSGSSCSSVTSAMSDSDVLSPDMLLSTLNTDVFLSLGIAPPTFEKSSTDVNNTAILSLIQNLTTNTPQVGEIPQFPLPMTIPLIPVLADPPLNTKKTVISKPSSSSKPPKGGPSPLNKQLKQALTAPSKSLVPVTAKSSTDSITDILSTQDFVKSQTRETKSPDTLANLAAAVLSSPENDLSDMLMSTVSEATSLCTPTVLESKSPVLDILSTDRPPKDTNEPTCCISDISIQPELIEEPMETGPAMESASEVMESCTLTPDSTSGNRVTPELAPDCDFS